jgi:hypothetical protein
VHNFKPTEFYGSIKMLNPGKSYIFRIQAETKIGYGPEAIWKQKMPILRKCRVKYILSYVVSELENQSFLVYQLSLIRCCFVMHELMQLIIFRIHDGNITLAFI